MFTPIPPGGARKETDLKVPLGGFRGKRTSERWHVSKNYGGNIKTHTYIRIDI